MTSRLQLMETTWVSNGEAKARDMQRAMPGRAFQDDLSGPARDERTDSWVSPRNICKKSTRGAKGSIVFSEFILVVSNYHSRRPICLSAQSHHTDSTKLLVCRELRNTSNVTNANPAIPSLAQVPSLCPPAQKHNDGGVQLQGCFHAC